MAQKKRGFSGILEVPKISSLVERTKKGLKTACIFSMNVGFFCFLLDSYKKDIIPKFVRIAIKGLLGTKFI
jgi:hypothetical protein